MQTQQMPLPPPQQQQQQQQQQALLSSELRCWPSCGPLGVLPQQKL
jgi:hypothetical protein